jgi:hypothetical protein
MFTYTIILILFLVMLNNMDFICKLCFNFKHRLEEQWRDIKAWL